MTEDQAKNLMAHIRSLWPRLDWAKEIQDEVFARMIRSPDIQLGAARQKLVDARIAIKFESIQPAEVWAAIAPPKPDQRPRTWSEMHPEHESERQRARESMRRLREKYRAATGLEPKGAEWHSFVMAG